MNDPQHTFTDLERAPLKIEPNADCPIFYAFGASYPDGQCHEGHLDDTDSDYCSKDFDNKPCPWCNNAAYIERLRDGGEVTPPFGFGKYIDGDYFILSFREMAEAESA